MPADVTFTPGAQLSRQPPRLENSASMSSLSLAPTVAAAGVAAEIYFVDAQGRPATELGVRVPDARIDDVDVHAEARRVVHVAAAQGETALVDAVQAPGGARLLLDRVRQLVLLDVGDEGARAQRSGPVGREIRDREAAERRRVDPPQRAAMLRGEALGNPADVGHVAPQHDDVAARDDVARGGGL